MAAKITPTLRSSLERLKHAGAVNGLCLAWRRQVLISLLPFEDYRADKLIHAVHEANDHFSSGGRNVQTFWFGFEGVHVLALRRDETSLIVLHSRAVEADFIAKAAEVFLEDCQLLVDASLNASGVEVDGEATHRLSGNVPPHEDEVAAQNSTNLILRAGM